MFLRALKKLVDASVVDGTINNISEELEQKTLTDIKDIEEQIVQIQSTTLELTKSKMQGRITEEYFNNEIQIKRQELRTLETKQQALQSQNATLAMSAERMKTIKSLAKNNALLEIFDPDILKSQLLAVLQNVSVILAASFGARIYLNNHFGYYTVTKRTIVVNLSSKICSNL